jgi:tetratricopeptide (TPR) repeat protein
MQDNLEYIDAYFEGSLNPEETKKFEQRIAEEKDFAEEVAFYLSAKQVSKEEANRQKKEWFRQLLTGNEPLAVKKPAVVRKMQVYRLAAAAAIIGVIFLSWYFFLQKPTGPDQLADNYITANLQALSVTLGPGEDSIQHGLDLYNKGELGSSLNLFETVIQHDTSNFTAKKYAGIVYLRLANYDKALEYFNQLGHYSLYSNPAKFYQALTLMKRNAPGDKQQARQLLQQVVQDHLEGEETARQWLKKW